MDGNVLVLCDTEEEYAQHMSAYLKEQREVMWEIHTYTDVKELIMNASKMQINMLVVAENAYSETLQELSVDRLVILNESGVVRFGNIPNVNKYQAAQEVYKAILNEYVEALKQPLPRLSTQSATKIIGFFTPVHRSLQTTFALTMGQILAKEYRTLYLNFEYCAGNAELLPDMKTRDLADLVFFLNTDKEKFFLRMQTIILKKGLMDYVPPVKAGMALLEVKQEEWLELIARIAGLGEYDYIILDLSESVQGLLEVLRGCDKIYTLTREECSARGKIAQYERLLEMAQYEELLGKSSRYRLPRFHKLPQEIELLTKGDLADYVQRILVEVTG